MWLERPDEEERGLLVGQVVSGQPRTGPAVAQPRHLPPFTCLSGEHPLTDTGTICLFAKIGHIRPLPRFFFIELGSRYIRYNTINS